MKRLISVVLALVMLLCVLTACGGANKDEVGGTISSPTAASTSPEGEKNDGEQEEDGKEIDLGEISGGAVYSNDFAGITFTLPEAWFFATEEELAELMNLSVEEIFEDDKQALLEYSMESTVYDMMAYSETVSENIMVMFENTARYLVGAFFGEDSYLDALESNFDMIKDFTYVIEGRSDVKLGQTEYRCLSTSIEGYEIYQDYLVRREGKYMICIAFTGTEPNPASAMGEWFS